MLKPVSILALDEPAATLAGAVAERVAAACGLPDLVQMRPVSVDGWRLAVGGGLAEAIASIHAQRQAPGSALRLRDDVSTRELVLLVVSAAGPARASLLDLLRDLRQLYDQRRLAEYYTIELLCLLPDVTGTAAVADYGAAYETLATLTTADPKPFDEVWLLDATNGNRVRFGALGEALDSYAEAVAGALMHEPEMSGALPGIHPRGMHPTFSTFGYAELFFPREVALQRLEPRFAAELLQQKLLNAGAATHSYLAAKQFVVGETFAVPLSRIGIDAGQSLFHRFQAKTFVTERTRSAEEVIAAVRNELKTHRDTTHLANLETLARQGEETTASFAAMLTRVVDETLDRDDYGAAVGLLDALLDPLPDLRADAEASPRNLVTELNAATAALDARLRFVPDTAGSDAARKRVRELDNLLQDQKLVADTLAPTNAAEHLAAIEGEQRELTRTLPERIFAEESGNNFARNAARDAEAARLAEETAGREQQLRELFAQKPRAEEGLREALEMRRTWLWRQVLWAAVGVLLLYGIPAVFGALLPNLARVNQIAALGLGLFAIHGAVRYLTSIAPAVRAAREFLQRLVAQIDTTDKAKNAAHNDELQFEHDIAHRRTTLTVLRRTREHARKTLDALMARRRELEELAAAFVPASIVSGGLSVSLIDDGDVDAWYDRTVDDRKPLVRDFPLRRSESLHLALDDLRARLAGYAASGFDAFRKLTIGAAAALVPEVKLTQRLKRFGESSAPLIELRDDLEAEKAMQRDTTLWVDAGDRAFVTQLQRRLPDAHVKPPADPLRVHAVSRVLHYPGYVLGQVEYYRAQYSGALDLLPSELVLSNAVRGAYEQVLLGRAFGLIEVRDGMFYRLTASLGGSSLSAAERLVSSSVIREELETELAPRLSIAAEVYEKLGAVAPLSGLDRSVIGGLMKRYGM
ncbi:MAG: hypothetical protein QOH21_2682 [Acidobacteriota bacterium]|jgi:hypothetical protein|nr:hypothetical protein [Acidobacteriota bacterium]